MLKPIHVETDPHGSASTQGFGFHMADVALYLTRTPTRTGDDRCFNGTVMKINN